MTDKVQSTQLPETIAFGGVLLKAAQIKEKGSFRDKGRKIFHVEFNNGIIVQYEDQDNKKINKYKIVKNTPSNFIENAGVTVYNVLSGCVQGTKKDDIIKLYCSMCIHVDGNGGKDIYKSKQNVNNSYNTYKMNKDVEYSKYTWKDEVYVKSAGEQYNVDNVLIPRGFRLGNYEIRDDENFSKESLNK